MLGRDIVGLLAVAALCGCSAAHGGGDTAAADAGGGPGRSSTGSTRVDASTDSGEGDSGAGAAAALSVDAATPPQALDAGGDDGGASCEQRAEAEGLSYQPGTIASVARYGDNVAAQTVTPLATRAVSGVVLPLYTCKQNFLADAQVQLLATTAEGVPDLTNVVATSDVVPSDELPIRCVIDEDAFERILFRFAAPVVLEATTPVAIGLSGVGDEREGELFWQHSGVPDSGEAPYPGGRPWSFDGRRQTWAEVLGEADFAFTFVSEDCDTRGD